MKRKKCIEEETTAVKISVLGADVWCAKKGDYIKLTFYNVHALAEGSPFGFWLLATGLKTRRSGSRITIYIPIKDTVETFMSPKPRMGPSGKMYAVRPIDMNFGD